MGQRHKETWQTLYQKSWEMNLHTRQRQSQSEKMRSIQWLEENIVLSLVQTFLGDFKSCLFLDFGVFP